MGERSGCCGESHERDTLKASQIGTGNESSGRMKCHKEHTGKLGVLSSAKSNLCGNPINREFASPTFPPFEREVMQQKKKKELRPPICPYCNELAKLVTGKEIYPHRPDLHSLKIWECKSCEASVGTHKQSIGIPLGRLANKELKKAKMSAHAAFDPLWKNGSMKRSDAYYWLSQKLGIHVKDCHIGMFDVDQCNKVVEVCRERDEHSREYECEFNGSISL
jgi:hypothetical protein